MFSGEKGVMRYIISLHRYDQPHNIYMTMRADVNAQGKVEHRHIQQSFSAFIQPFVQREFGFNQYPSIPHRLSMLMHVATMHLLKDIGIAYTELIIEPLIPMLRILKKSGFVPLDAKEQNGTRIVIQGSYLKELYNYEKEAQNAVTPSNYVIGECVGCGDAPQWRCKHCLQPVLCNECVHVDIHECV